MLLRSLLLSALATLSLPLISAPAFADDDEPFRLFGCALGPAETDWMVLEGVQHDDDTFTDLQFTIEQTGKPTIKIPSKPVSGPGHFFYSTSNGPEGFLNTVRFVDQGKTYVLDMLTIQPDPNDENDMGGQANGLTITAADGTITRLPCGETYEYVGYMADSMDCDPTNRYGAAGCTYDTPPERTKGDMAIVRAVPQ